MTAERGESGNSGAWVSPLPPDVPFVHASREDQPGFRLYPQERALLGPGAARKRIMEFTLGRGCARAALARLDPALAGSPILREHGRRPLWPAGVVGAITHHHGQAAAAVAREGAYRGLGLDLEAERAPSEGLLKRILRPEEQRALEALPPAERARRALLIFSAKESIFKALNPIRGIYIGFQDAAVTQIDEPRGQGRGGLRWRLHHGCGADFPAGYEGEGGYARRNGWVMTGVWLNAG
jgi:4'-phosphopantetheinyl transferase EntD